MMKGRLGSFIDRNFQIKDPKSKAQSQPTLDKPVGLEFDFQLAGGPKHTEILIASATIKSGPNEGMPLPLKCKWFNKTEHELVEINGVSGAFYQPCIDDVGTIIAVEATPIVDESEYRGGPIRKEVGPILMDGQIESSAEAYLLTGNHFNIRIESVQFEYPIDTFSFPCEGAIEVNKQENKLIVLAKNKSTGAQSQLICCDISYNYPQIKLQKWTNNIFDAYFAPDKGAKLSCKNNTERDIYSLCIRIVAAEQLMKAEAAGLMEKTEIGSPGLKSTQENSTATTETAITTENTVIKSDETQPTENDLSTGLENHSPRNRQEVALIKEDTSKPKPNFEMLMKINNLSNENYTLKKEKAHLQEELQSEIAKNKQLTLQINDLNDQLNETNKSFDGLLERSEQLKKNNDKLNSEKVFCMQEINLYKNQIAELTEAYENLKAEIETGAATEKEKSTQEAELEKSLRMAEHQRDTWKAKALSSEIENENLKAEIEKLAVTSTSIKQQNEGLESQINHLNRKYQSLLQETERAKKALKVPKVQRLNSRDLKVTRQLITLKVLISSR